MVIFTPDKRYTDMEQSFDLSPELAKQARYEAFLPRLAALIEGIDDEVAVLANTAAALREAFGFFWVGFYRVAGGELRLGPFQGTVACYRIRKGRGVCGTAFAEGRSIVVPDVEQFPGPSPAARSRAPRSSCRSSRRDRTARYAACSTSTATAPPPSTRRTAAGWSGSPP